MERKFLEELVKKWEYEPATQSAYEDSDEGRHQREVESATMSARKSCAADLKTLLMLFPW